MRGYETIVIIAFVVAISLSALSLVFAYRTIGRVKQISQINITKES